MRQLSENEYLSRPLIEETTFTIEDDHVKITSPSTIHVGVRRIIPVESKKELLALYKRVFRKAKSQGSKISYQHHTRKLITERWDEYAEICMGAASLFRDIIEQAKIVQARGLHYGTRDDVELENLQKLCFQHEKNYCNDSIICEFSSAYNRLLNLEQDLSSLNSPLEIIYL